MNSIYKKTNELGISTFKINSDGNGCKIVVNNHGHIIKAYCGKSDYMALVYSENDTNKSYLENVLYEMLLLSKECFWEIVKEIKEISKQAIAAASELDEKLASIA